MPDLDLLSNKDLHWLTYHMLGLPFINLNDILGNLCHNRSQTLHSVVHVVLQCGILRQYRHEEKGSKTLPVSPGATHKVLQTGRNSILHTYNVL